MAAWWHCALPSDKETLEELSARAAHATTGVPSHASCRDIPKEARPDTLGNVALYKCLHCYLEAKARGGIHAATAEGLFLSKHPTRVFLGKVKGLRQTVDGFKNRSSASTMAPATHPVFSTTTPGGLLANLLGDRKETTHAEEGQPIPECELSTMDGRIGSA